MTTPFEQALNAAKDALRVLNARTVAYCTGTFEIEVSARVGQTTFRLETGEQFNTRQRSRDFLIAAEDLVHPETLEPFEPAPGHRIRETIGNRVHTFECLPFGDEPAWRWSGTPGREYRIHTKRVSEEELA